MPNEEISQSQNPDNTLPNMPPPPPEVKVRTMRTDLSALAASGGAGSSTFRTVSVEGLTLTKAAVANGSGAMPKKPKSSSGVIWGIIALAIVILGLIAWFGYMVFMHGK